jgi:phosphoserine phosphatase
MADSMAEPLLALLVAPPGGLAAALAQGLCAAWGGGPLAWLAPGEAAEFALNAEPPDLWERWDSLQAEGVDLLPVPAQGRRKRLLVADMDSTMIRQECIDELAALAGAGAAVAAVTARAMAGEIDFAEALKARVALLAGLPATAVDRVLAERITLMPGGAELLATMRGWGARAVLVSGGFTAFAEPIARRLGFDEMRANRLLARDGVLTGEVAEPILGREAKAEALREAAQRLGLGLAETLAVGDGANDLGMLSIAGLGVALHAKPVVQAACRLRVNHGDLTALLFLQGVRRADFADPDGAFSACA